MRSRGLAATDDRVNAVAAGLSAGLVACAVAMSIAGMPEAEAVQGGGLVLVVAWLVVPAIAAGLLAAGLLARHGSPGVTLGWFVAASWMARVAIGSVRLAVTSDARVSWPWALGLATVAAIALILTLLAWTPRRRLGRWMLPVGLGCGARATTPRHSRASISAGSFAHGESGSRCSQAMRHESCATRSLRR
jgi:hypothetical protein